ncbi:glycoside hydrolase family 3 protein [Pilobolus umbonatus]|nr:glycoside hydrolase family 3 protein [Pilobolus umbonatus]
MSIQSTEARYERDMYDKPTPIDGVIISMLERMTLPEKIGQMTQLNQDMILLPDGTLNRTAVEHYAKNYHVGSYLNQLASDGVNYDVEGYARIIEEIQEITLSVESTFKVPIIYGLDSIHGAHYIANTTIFPHGINLGASFNPELAYHSASITARESRAAGVHWTFAPVLDIPVNKLWPRVYENFGEDPLLSSAMGIAAIRGYQGKYKSDRSKIAACMKHFIAYGAPWTGQDRDSTVVSDRTVYDYFLPGFQAAVDAGVATTMATFIDINGEPVVASEKYLKRMLRDRMKFEGMLVTDWEEIKNLYTLHKVVANNEEAVKLAIDSSSLDMSMVPQDTNFFDAMIQLVEDGKISMARVDESVGRILQLKKDLGLLAEDGWKGDKKLQKMVGNEEGVEVALNIARESITLLENKDDVLPFGENIKSVLIVGPTGNDLGHMSGGWTIQWQGATVDAWHGDIDDTQFYGRGVTIHSGIELVAPKGTLIKYMQGFKIDGMDVNMDEVIMTAKDFDAIVVCAGEHVYAELPGNIHDIRLPYGQIESVKRLSQTGKPVVTVLVEGRPRVLDSIPDSSNALLQVYLPGPWGGKAIAEVLFGKVNPSGRLPYTYPKHSADLSLNYWRPVSDTWDPLYEFGHGLSYSSFTYSNITYMGTTKENFLTSNMYENRKIVPGEADKIVTIEITNNSPVDGKESVLMYVQQNYRRVTPPAKLLKGFQKVHIASGMTTAVQFNINADMFRYTGIDGIPNATLDNGPVKVLIGDQSFEFEVQNST